MSISSQAPNRETGEHHNSRKILSIKKEFAALKRRLEKAEGYGSRTPAQLVIGATSAILFLLMAPLDAILLEQPLEILLPPMAHRIYTPVGQLDPLACLVAIIAIIAQTGAILVVFETHSETAEDGKDRSPLMRVACAAVLLVCLFLACYGGYMRGAEPTGHHHHTVSPLVSNARYLNLALSFVTTVMEWVFSFFAVRGLILGPLFRVYLRWRVKVFRTMHARAIETVLTPSEVSQAQTDADSLKQRVENIRKAADAMSGSYDPSTSAGAAHAEVVNLVGTTESDILRWNGQIPVTTAGLASLEHAVATLAGLESSCGKMIEVRDRELAHLIADIVSAESAATSTATAPDLRAALDQYGGERSMIFATCRDSIERPEFKDDYDDDSKHATLSKVNAVVATLDGASSRVSNSESLARELQQRIDGTLKPTKPCNSAAEASVANALACGGGTKLSPAEIVAISWKVNDARVKAIEIMRSYEQFRGELKRTWQVTKDRFEEEREQARLAREAAKRQQELEADRERLAQDAAKARQALEAEKERRKVEAEKRSLQIDGEHERLMFEESRRKIQREHRKLKRSPLAWFFDLFRRRRPKDRVAPLNSDSLPLLGLDRDDLEEGLEHLSARGGRGQK